MIEEEVQRTSQFLFLLLSYYDWWLMSVLDRIVCLYCFPILLTDSTCHSDSQHERHSCAYARAILTIASLSRAFQVNARFLSNTCNRKQQRREQTVQ